MTVAQGTTAAQETIVARETTADQGTTAGRGMIVGQETIVDQEKKERGAPLLHVNQIAIGKGLVTADGQVDRRAVVGDVQPLIHHLHQRSVQARGGQKMRLHATTATATRHVTVTATATVATAATVTAAIVTATGTSVTVIATASLPEETTGTETGNHQGGMIAMLPAVTTAIDARRHDATTNLATLKKMNGNQSQDVNSTPMSPTFFFMGLVVIYLQNLNSCLTSFDLSIFYLLISDHALT